MRPELNEIQYIEFYLQGKLDKAQRLAFEKKMLSDAGFKQKVELQQQLMQGIKNRALRHSIAKAYRKFSLKKKLKWGLGGTGMMIAVAGIVIALQFSGGSETSFSSETMEPSVTVDGKEIAPENLAGNTLENQLFTIQGDQDTVIQTKDGISFAIEAGTFINEDGEAIDGEIKVAVKEALKVDDILSSGLSTVTTSGEQLETGGMFSINAVADDEVLTIHPQKGIFTQVPTDEKKSGMSLWQGKYQKDGQILWEQPKQLEQFLIPIDMSLLNFYPKDFESNLERLGFPNATKKQKDSVYYSFVSHFTKKGRAQFLVEDEHENSLKDKKHTELNHYVREGYYRYPLKTGLNPAKVKAFWNEKFNGSLLATKEFEKRMHLIHQTGSGEILDLYIKNADKRISEIDAMAAEQSMGKLKNKFNAFASLDEGRVKSNPRLVKMLNGFYRQKELAFKQSLAKVNAFWATQKEKDKKAAKAIKSYSKKEAERLVDNFKKEFQDNLDTVYKQLGYKKGPRVTYNARVTSTGWNNIDKKVLQATTSRSSMTITKNGKTAKLSYSELKLTCKNNYDRLYAYVLTPSLPSYQRMRYATDKGVHDFKLNDFYRYGLAVIGYKGDSVYTFFESKLSFDSVYATMGDSVRLKSIVLKSQSENEFFKTVKKFSKGKSFKTDIKKDMLFEKFLQSEKKRQFKLQEMVNFRREMQEYVFPLYYLEPNNYKLPYNRIRAVKIWNEKGSDRSLIFVKSKHNFKDLREKEELNEYESKSLGLLDKLGRTYLQFDKRGKFLNIRFLEDESGGMIYFEFQKNMEREFNDVPVKKIGHYWVAEYPLVRGMKLFFIESNFELLVSEFKNTSVSIEPIEE